MNLTEHIQYISIPKPFRERLMRILLDYKEMIVSHGEWLDPKIASNMNIEMQKAFINGCADRLDRFMGHIQNSEKLHSAGE